MAGKKKVSSTDKFEGAFSNFPKIIESTDMQSSFDLRDNIKLEEEVIIQESINSIREEVIQNYFNYNIVCFLYLYYARFYFLFS